MDEPRREYGSRRCINEHVLFDFPSESLKYKKKNTFALAMKNRSVILFVLVNRATDFILGLENLEILHMQHLNENFMEILNLENLEKGQIFVLEKLLKLDQ